MLMKTDSLGIPRFTNRDLIDMIYSGNIDRCHVVLCDLDNDIDKFNVAMEEQGLPLLQKYIPLDVDEKTFDNACQSEWFMPEQYKNIVIDEFLKTKLIAELKTSSLATCVLSKEWHRAEDELSAFKKHNMFNLLRYMIYLVDFMRENNIVWGVGRGSSVASYVLYLIGVHRINSIQYNLDWQDFIR